MPLRSAPLRFSAARDSTAPEHGSFLARVPALGLLSIPAAQPPQHLKHLSKCRGPRRAQNAPPRAAGSQQIPGPSRLVPHTRRAFIFEQELEISAPLRGPKAGPGEGMI